MCAVRILFVDDDVNILNSMKRNFHPVRDEWDISICTSAEQALSVMKEKTFRILITDYKMPGMNGLELLDTVKRLYPETMRVLLTGQSESQVYERSGECADAYLSKPVSPEELINLLQSLINRRE